MFEAAELIRWLTHYLDFAVFGVLTLMSIIMLACALERYWTLYRVDVHQYRHESLLQAGLTNNLTIIASIGSLAPYVGLLGTVLGILVTFHELGQADQIDAKSVMTGLALALKATAAGLLVAIPAMFFYNQLSRRVDVLVARWQAEQPAI